MMRSIPIAMVALLALALPGSAQEGNVAMGVFVTVDLKDTETFESAMQEHNEWHADQNDTWTWAAYQALGGVTEYAIVSPGHSWADFDNPPVSMAADAAEFAGSDGAQVATGEEISIQETLPELGNEPPSPLPIAQVIEFQVHGSEEVFLNTLQKYKEATAGADGTYFGWARVVSADQPPTYFIVVWANSFAELGQAGPTPQQIMAAAHGETAARQLMDAAGEVSTNTSSRIWIARPDLSYIPNQSFRLAAEHHRAQQ